MGRPKIFKELKKSKIIAVKVNSIFYAKLMKVFNNENKKLTAFIIHKLIGVLEDKGEL